jgi:ABC-type molybdate transport system ATPase subunit
MPGCRRRRRRDGQAGSEAGDGRYEAGALIDTHVSAQNQDDQLTVLAFDGGELIVPHIDAAVGERVRARIRARDVSLATQMPAGISILNILAGRVVAVGTRPAPLSMSGWTLAA